jgi:auxin efflux carrier family protein
VNRVFVFYPFSTAVVHRSEPVNGAPPPPTTPATGTRGSSFGASEVYSVHSSRGRTLLQSNFDEQHSTSARSKHASVPSHDAKELHMFMWSSSASPVSEVSGLPVFTTNGAGAKEIRMVLPADLPQNGKGPRQH